jgi:hypothetical protein
MARDRRQRIARVEAKRPREPKVIVRHEPAPAATRIVEVLRGLLERLRAQR